GGDPSCATPDLPPDVDPVCDPFEHGPVKFVTLLGGAVAAQLLPLDIAPCVWSRPASRPSRVFPRCCWRRLLACLMRTSLSAATAASGEAPRRGAASLPALRSATAG